MDTIERQAAIDICLQYCPDDDGTCSRNGDDLRNMLDEIEALPSAQPEPCEDAVSRKAVIDAIDEWNEACADSGHKETVSDIKLIRKDFIDLPPVTPKQSLDIEKVSKEVLNATSKWLTDQDDKRNVLDVIKDVLQPYKGKE